jgi:hypothetical protein
MAFRIANRSLHKPLQDAGLVPPNCRLMDIKIGVDGAMVVVYECFLDMDQLAKLAAVLAAAADSEISQSRKD